MNILVIDPGSTSTKIGIYKNKSFVCKKNISHDRDILNSFKKIIDQKKMRSDIIKNYLNENNFDKIKFDAIAGRGGLLKPIEGGTYIVNKKMLTDLASDEYCLHPSNLGGIIAHDFAEIYICNAYIVDPVVIDEMDNVAKISGLKGIERKSQFHALNQKKVAKTKAKELGKKYNELSFIVAHLGGGISIGAHYNGKVIDVNNALDGDGPMSPERSGSLPICGIIDAILDGTYKLEDFRKTVAREGGILSYLNTTNMLNVEKRALKKEKGPALMLNALSYQISKEIGALATVLKGKVDGIILTGGLAKSDLLIKQIKEHIDFIGPVYIAPGEFELEALAEGVERVLTGEEKVKRYK